LNQCRPARPSVTSGPLVAGPRTTGRLTPHFNTAISSSDGCFSSPQRPERSNVTPSHLDVPNQNKTARAGGVDEWPSPALHRIIGRLGVGPTGLTGRSTRAIHHL